MAEQEEKGSTFKEEKKTRTFIERNSSQAILWKEAVDK